MQASAFVGLRVREAEQLAASEGLYLEVLDSMVVDAMVDSRRVRVVVSDGVVKHAWRDCQPAGEPRTDGKECDGSRP